ncbi:Uncharacterized protein TCM_046328, partial [Theobroma cacao]
MFLVKHLSDVMKDRAILLYVMVTGKSINVGKLIFNNIVHYAISTRDSIWYPSLITALCKQAGVQWSSEEELLHLKAPLGPNIIHRLVSSAGGSSSFALRSPPHPTHLTIPKRFEHLEHQMAYQANCMRVMKQMFSACALHIGMDMTSFPSMLEDH